MHADFDPSPVLLVIARLMICCPSRAPTPQRELSDAEAVTLAVAQVAIAIPPESGGSQGPPAGPARSPVQDTAIPAGSSTNAASGCPARSGWLGGVLRRCLRGQPRHRAAARRRPRSGCGKSIDTSRQSRPRRGLWLQVPRRPLAPLHGMRLHGLLAPDPSPHPVQPRSSQPDRAPGSRRQPVPRATPRRRNHHPRQGATTPTGLGTHRQRPRSHQHPARPHKRRQTKPPPRLQPDPADASNQSSIPSTTNPPPPTPPWPAHPPSPESASPHDPLTPNSPHLAQPPTRPPNPRTRRLHRRNRGTNHLEGAGQPSSSWRRRLQI